MPNLTHACVPNVLKLSSNVKECKPLVRGRHHPRLGRYHGGAALRGRVVQVDPIRRTLKAPGTKRLKL